MKKVFKCDYCNYIGTAEEVTEHEKTCLKNPDVKCCYNCQYAYTRSSTTLDLTLPFVCSYNITEPNKDTLYMRSKPLPDKEVCEHYKKGKPRQVIGV